MANRLDLLPAAALQDLLARCHGCHLHRLRGVMQRLTGWASLGGADRPEDLQACLTESSELLDSLAQLGPGGDSFDFEKAQSMDWPERLLGSAMRWGTPQEWSDALPCHGTQAVATALYLEALFGEARELRIRIERSNEAVLLIAEGAPSREIDSQLASALEPWICERQTEVGEHRNVRCLSLPKQPVLAEFTQSDAS